MKNMDVCGFRILFIILLLLSCRLIDDDLERKKKIKSADAASDVEEPMDDDEKLLREGEVSFCCPVHQMLVAKNFAHRVPA